MSELTNYLQNHSSEYEDPEEPYEIEPHDIECYIDE